MTRVTWFSSKTGFLVLATAQLLGAVFIVCSAWLKDSVWMKGAIETGGVLASGSNLGLLFFPNQAFFFLARLTHSTGVASFWSALVAVAVVCGEMVAAHRTGYGKMCVAIILASVLGLAAVFFI